jgi:hypothetical protein
MPGLLARLIFLPLGARYFAHCLSLMSTTLAFSSLRLPLLQLISLFVLF